MMKLLAIAGIALGFIGVCGVASADVYEIYVKRVDKDLYKTAEGFYIETKYCYHYSYGENAILRFEQYSYDNKIIFNNDESCDVKKIFK